MSRAPFNVSAAWLVKSVSAKSILNSASIVALSVGLGSVMPMALASEAAARQGDVVAQAAVQAYDLAVGDLNATLQKIAEQSNVSLVFDGDMSGMTTQTPITGTLSALQALELALKGSGFSLKKLNENTFSIRALAASKDPAMMEQIVVTAGRVSRSSRALPASVIVINADEIEQHRQGGGDAASLVSKFVPGIASANQTMSGASQTFRGRGVQVLVDGQSRNTPLRNVSRTFTVVDLNQIERIEVVPGARSDYGNGATGGTINFITKAATEEHQVTVKFGVSAFTQNVGKSAAPLTVISASGSEGALDYAATFSAEMTRNAYTGKGEIAPSDPLIGQGGLDNSDTFNLGLKGGWNISETKRLQASLTMIELNQEPEYTTDYSTDPVSANTSDPYDGDSVRERSQYFALDYTDQDMVIGDVAAKFFVDNIAKRFAFAPVSAVNPAVPAIAGSTTVNPDGQSEIFTKRIGVRLTVDNDLGSLVEGMKFTWGGDASYDDTSQELQDGQDRIAPMKQVGLAGFGQVSVPFSIFEFSGGLRYEYFDLKIDDFTRPAYTYLVAANTFVAVPEVDVTGGSHTYSEMVVNAGVVAHVSEPVDVFVNYSEGFSIPDVGGYTARAGFGGIPTDFSSFSPKANVVRSLETGIRYNKFGVRGELSAYVSHSDYGTTYDLGTNSLSQQKERIWGAEVSGLYPVNDWLSLGGVASFIRGSYDTDSDGKLDADLPANRIPSEFRTSLYADMDVLEELNFRVTGNYAGGRSGRSSTGDFDVDPSFTLDLSARYPLLGGELAGGVMNLFDSGQDNVTATAVRGYPTTEYGRRISISYSKTF